MAVYRLLGHSTISLRSALYPCPESEQRTLGQTHPIVLCFVVCYSNAVPADSVIRRSLATEKRRYLKEQYI